MTFKVKEKEKKNPKNMVDKNTICGQSILFGNMGTSSDQDKDGDHQMPKGFEVGKKKSGSAGAG